MEDLDRIKLVLQATLRGDRGDANVNLGSTMGSDFLRRSPENTMARYTAGTDSAFGPSRVAEQRPMPTSNSVSFPSQKPPTTSALDLLRWPKIEGFVSRPPDAQTLLQIELTRKSLHIDPPLSLDLDETAVLVQAFFEHVNIWYACVNPHEWAAYYQKAESVLFREGPESCAVLLVLALGSASLGGSVAQLRKGSDPPGVQYFSAAWGLMPSLILCNSVTSLQCSVLAAAYLLYLVRPLEAWTLLSGSSMKLQLILHVAGAVPEVSVQLSERLYWNMLLMESDLLTQLDLPSYGIVQFEGNIAIPTFFPELPDAPGRDELWYLQAAIDLRQLHTRISQEISSKESSSPDELRAISQDLDMQVYNWYEALPMNVRFPLNRGLLQHPAQTVLRLRYFAARAAIFRPYVLAVLEDENAAQVQFIRDNCRTCLVSCTRQLEDISVDRSGHVPHLWQNTLSFMSQALLVMGATTSPSLLQFLEPLEQLDAMLMDVVEEIERYADLAPSLRLCGEVLREAEERRRTSLHRTVGMGF